MTETSTEPANFAEIFAKDPDLVTQRDGVNAFGFYVELVRVTAFNKEFDRHIKAFVLENSFSLYVRDAGKKAGRWKTTYTTDYTQARNTLIKILDLDTPGRVTTIRGEPLLLQATVADLVTVRKKDHRGPDCRWRGGATLDARYGKVTDAYKAGEES